MRAARDGVSAGFESSDPPPDGGLPAAAAIVSGPGDGERLADRNRVYLVKAALTEIFFSEWSVDGPRDGPTIHHHDDQVDSFYVLEGEIEVTVNDTVHSAGPGTLASIPRGALDTFAHRNQGRARLLNVHTPDAGFAELIRRAWEPGSAAHVEAGNHDRGYGSADDLGGDAAGNPCRRRRCSAAR